MITIKDTFIKKSDSYPKHWCLVHDGKTVIALVPPGGKTWVGANRTMLIGTEKELRKKIKQLETPSILRRIAAKFHLVKKA